MDTECLVYSSFFFFQCFQHVVPLSPGLHFLMQNLLSLKFFLYRYGVIFFSPCFQEFFLSLLFLIVWQWYLWRGIWFRVPLTSWICRFLSVAKFAIFRYYFFEYFFIAAFFSTLLRSDVMKVRSFLWSFSLPPPPPSLLFFFFRLSTIYCFVSSALILSFFLSIFLFRLSFEIYFTSVTVFFTLLFS